MKRTDEDTVSITVEEAREAIESGVLTLTESAQVALDIVQGEVHQGNVTLKNLTIEVCDEDYYESLDEYED